MPKTFFTSDSHYGHKNIVESLSTWADKSGCRKNFRTIEEMNDILVAGINRVVNADDTLYHLGDFNFGGIKNQREFRSRLVCENIHLILGNHDFNHGSIPIESVDHGFTTVRPYAEIVVKGQEIILFHYGMRVWNRQGKGSWHLYGHSHAKLPAISNFSLDVGVDNFLSLNYGPLSFEQLQTYFAQRGDSVKCEDGHAREEQSRPISA